MKKRKHLSADGLFKIIKKEFKKVKDHRPINVEIPLENALMSGFALFSLKEPSLSTPAYVFGYTRVGLATPCPVQKNFCSGTYWPLTREGRHQKT
ncbi:hypothetical protein MNBD_CHLOROFLEXI01-1009 [hydrothermal vent metagenome]|uniref:Uncharacterized protein n=1 Tax=hydrothermal vent metagenome TaxID=652676 RepID=A0A3B0UWS7_9ZZZZ